ncbi:succinate dehydrogenase iron-sulfur subunit [Calderihabitans maritimus]|uniref:succinate dehydrogenase n=1 Tax=Calderihabitans maritimus TaxID=1246530 RepID=A0A1Z5HTE6_9FIRM|nr:succinate dehydrogenase iron-sulfur subunit [Calderihabitans maritimus]GAW92813.1 Succinate dehydrogenase iron-sulfur subunit [Calderihabitans maritimus]
MADKIRLRIRRQASPQDSPYWEEFEVEYEPNMNVVSALMAIQRNPVNADGKPTTPVVWECNCLEEVCGACTMIINGKVRQACSALVDRLAQPIVLQPLTKFPLIKDLKVDRSVMFENLKKVKAWIPIDGFFDLGPGPRFPEKTRRWAYELSRCMTCGCCMEVCPNVNQRSNFIGPAAIAQVRLFNAHPTGAMHKEERLDALMEEGGIAECGNAQNCVRACPKQIPLTTSIAELNRETVVHGLKRWLSK